MLAELVATGRQPDLIAPLPLERFYEDSLVRSSPRPPLKPLDVTER